MNRCDRTAAWAALQGHYQAHGRGLDLREAFARMDADRSGFIEPGERGSGDGTEVFVQLRNRLK